MSRLHALQRPITPGPRWRPGHCQDPVDAKPRGAGARERRVRRVRPPRPARLRPPRRRWRRRSPDPMSASPPRSMTPSPRPSTACALPATPGPRSAPGSASPARPPSSAGLTGRTTDDTPDANHALRPHDPGQKPEDSPRPSFDAPIVGGCGRCHAAITAMTPTTPASAIRLHRQRRVATVAELELSWTPIRCPATMRPARPARRDITGRLLLHLSLPLLRDDRAFTMQTVA